MSDIHDIEQVIRIHDKIIDETGGLKGTIDVGLLDGALAKPFMGLADGTEFYPDIAAKAAILFESLINYHPFVDGNKRTAETITTIFLWNNGFIWDFNEGEIVDFAIDVAEGKLNIDNIKDWIKRRLRKRR